MKHKAPLFGLLGAVLLSAAFWYLLYQPKSEELAGIHLEIEGLQSQQASLRNEISSLEALQKDEMAILAELERLNQFIPADAAQPAVVRQFQETADAAGVAITSVNFGPPKPVEGAPATGDADTVLAGIPVNMIVEGGYFQAVDFLRRLEVDVPRAVLLTSLTMAEGEEAFPSLQTTWSGHLFAVVPVIPGPAPEPTSSESEGAEAPDEQSPSDGEDAAAEDQS